MILVVGATGSVGSKVVDSLLKDQHDDIRILVRGKNDWEASKLPTFRRQGINVIVGDAYNTNTVKKAVQGCSAIINCSGAIRAEKEMPLDCINIDAVGNLVDLGKEAGVQRFIQLSCLGATEHSTNHYFAGKWEAEEIVRKSGMFWTIFKPSLIFDSENNKLMEIIKFWVGKMPFIIIVGSGLNRFQPVSADDVASCIIQSIYDKDTVSKTYEIVGPEEFDLISLLTKAANIFGKSNFVLKIPTFIGLPICSLLGLKDTCPIDASVMSIMTAEMISDNQEIQNKFKLKQNKYISCLKTIVKELEQESN